MADTWTSATVSRGLCAFCQSEFEAGGGRLADFLETLDGPVLLADVQGRVLAANSRVHAMVGKDSASLPGRLCGEVFDCVRSSLPGGCGGTAFCTSCPLRAAITFTSATGETGSGVRVVLSVAHAGRSAQLNVLLALERVGTESVLIRFEMPGLAKVTPPTRPEAGPRPLRVLVIDDNESVRRMMARVLREAGHWAVGASTGRHAVRQVRLAQIDVVVTELVMPEHDGFETMQQLRGAFPDLPVVVVSGVFTEGVMHAARALGANATLSLPLDGDALLATLREVTRDLPDPEATA